MLPQAILTQQPDEERQEQEELEGDMFSDTEITDQQHRLFARQMTTKLIHLRQLN